MKPWWRAKEASEALKIDERSFRRLAKRQNFSFRVILNPNGGAPIKEYEYESFDPRTKYRCERYFLTHLPEPYASMKPPAEEPVVWDPQPEGGSGGSDFTDEELSAISEACDRNRHGPTATFEEGLKLWSEVPDEAKLTAMARRDVLDGEERFIWADESGKRNVVKLQEVYYRQMKAAVSSKDTAAMRRLGFNEEEIQPIFDRVKFLSLKNGRRWRLLFKRAEKKYGVGIYGLAPKKRPKKGAGSKTVSPDLKAYVRQLIVKHQVQIFPASKKNNKGRLIDLNRTHLYRRVKAAFGRAALPDYSNFTRWLNAYLHREQEGLAAIVLPSYWRSTFAPKGGSASEDVTYAGQLWEMDGTTADVMLKDGRYELIAAIDVWSRDVVISIEKHGSSVTVARTMFDGIMRWGVPRTIVSDRGTIFISDHIKGAADSLDIALKPCLAYAPYQKPHIESFMAVIAKMLFEAMTWFVGHDPKQRRRIEEYDRFTQVFFHSKGEKVSCDATAEELRETIGNWLDKVYRVEDHKFADCARHNRPANVTERRIKTPERAPEVKNVAILDLLLAPRIERVFNSGISWRNDTYLPIDVANWERVQPYAQHRVIFRPALSDVGKGALWELLDDGKAGDFICQLSCKARGGMDLEEFNHSRARIEKGHKQRRRAVDIIFNPPSYETELQLMQQPKVATANFGAEEFSGRAYETAKDKINPDAGDGGSTGGALKILKGGRGNGRKQEQPAAPASGLSDEIREAIAFQEAYQAEEEEKIRAREREESLGLLGRIAKSIQDDGLPAHDILGGLVPAEQYEKLMEMEARGEAIPSQYQRSMLVFEQSDTYRIRRDYYEQRRAALVIANGRGKDGDE